MMMISLIVVFVVVISNTQQKFQVHLVAAGFNFNHKTHTQNTSNVDFVVIVSAVLCFVAFCVTF